MNGGPETDCVGKEEDDCPNYTFDDIAYHHFPASIAGVLEYSGESEIHYIGHSNGGRSALFGLNTYSQTGKIDAGEVWDYQVGDWVEVDLPDHPVDKFFGVGVPSTLNGDSVFTSLARNYGDYGLANIEDVNHTLMSQYARGILKGTLLDFFFIPGAKELNTLGYMLVGFGDNAPLSQNVMKFYNDLAVDNETELDLSNLEINELYLHNGFPTDAIVPISDADIIYHASSLINDSNKNITPYNNWDAFENHVYITDNRFVKKNIIWGLKNE
jgi:hypothetical protein